MGRDIPWPWDLPIFIYIPRIDELIDLQLESESESEEIQVQARGD